MLKALVTGGAGLIGSHVVDLLLRRGYAVRIPMAHTSPLRSIGWEPTVSVEAGVRRYAEWILSMKRPAEYFTKAEEALKRARVVRQAKSF
jgi:nucleoside-diphosphate-sugar epimerase